MHTWLPYTFEPSHDAMMTFHLYHEVYIYTLHVSGKTGQRPQGVVRLVWESQGGTYSKTARYTKRCIPMSVTQLFRPICEGLRRSHGHELPDTVWPQTKAKDNIDRYNSLLNDKI